jgi:hypothetical protein
MDRGTILDHFHQAAEHVRQGIVHVRNQESLIAGIKARGIDSTEAVSLLKQFKEMLELHRADFKPKPLMCGAG